MSKTIHDSLRNNFLLLASSFCFLFHIMYDVAIKKLLGIFGRNGTIRLFSLTSSLSLFNNTVCSEHYWPLSAISQRSKNTNYFNNTLRVLKSDNWAQDVRINVLIAVEALNWYSQHADVHLCAYAKVGKNQPLLLVSC